MAARVGGIYVEGTANMGAYNRALTNAAAHTERQSSRMRSSLDTTRRSTDGLQRTMGRGFNTRGLAYATRDLASAQRRMDLMRTTAIALTGAFGGISTALAVNAVQQYADSYTSLQNRIRSVTTSDMQRLGVEEEIYRVARDTRSEVGATATLYTRLVRSASKYGLSLAQAGRVTETLNKTFATGGLTQQERSSVAIQFSQSLAANRLGGEEFRALAETPVLGMIADEAGITMKKLYEMRTEGALDAEFLLTNLEKLAPRIDDLFERSEATIAEAFTVFDNELGRYIGQADKAIGASQMLAEGIMAVADNLDTVMPTIGMAATGLVGVTAGRAGGALANRGLERARASALTRANAVSDARADLDAARQNQQAAANAVAGEKRKQAAIQRTILVKAEAQRADAQASVMAARRAQLEASGAQARLSADNAAIASTQRLMAVQTAQARAQYQLAVGMARATGNVNLRVKAEQALLQAQSAENSVKATFAANEDRIAQARRASAAAAQQLAASQSALAAAERNVHAQSTVTAASTRALAAAQASQAAASTAATAAQARLNAALVATTIRARAAALSSRSLAFALGALGGPAGIAITALTVGLTILMTRQSDAAKAADVHDQAMAELSGEIFKVANASEAAQGELRQKIAVDVASARSAVENARANYEQARSLEAIAGAERRASRLRGDPTAQRRRAVVDAVGADELSALDGAQSRLSDIEEQAALLDSLTIGSTGLSFPVGDGADDGGKESRKAKTESERAADRYKEKVEELKQTIASAGLDEFDREVLSTARSLDIAADEMQQFIASNGDLSMMPPKMRELHSLMQQVEAVRFGQQVAEDLVDVNARLTEYAEKLEAARLAGTLTAEQVGDAWREHVLGMEEFAWIDGFSSAVSDTLGKTINDFDNWRDHVASLLKQVGEIALQELALKPLREALSGGLASLFGGVKGGGGGNILSSLLSVFTGRATVKHSGGVAGSPGVERMAPMMGTSALSGNEVPAILKRGEMVLTPAQQKRAGGGGASSLTVIVEGARGNAEIEEMVSSGVAQGLTAYDAGLPGRIANYTSRGATRR